tara:strand:+ start:433 stop:1155 length:723 start_codon:yes stop_codon:yes gene_type:complete
MKDKIIKDFLPQHIAIIMDGNGRWAKERGMPRLYGHKKGVEVVRNITEAASKIGIKNLTLFTFSSENWNRPEKEVKSLMKLLLSSLKNEITNLEKNNIRLTAIGKIDALGPDVKIMLQDSIEKTKKNSGLNLNLALNYGSRMEIISAIKNMFEDLNSKEIDFDSISEKLFSKYLFTKNIKDPDLLIRTGKEHRISNFLLWQIAYTEIYFSKKYWPDFDKDQFYHAIFDFQKRDRRFGGIN